jgi:hypothetical protein
MISRSRCGVIDPRTDKVTDRIPLKGQTQGGYKVSFSPTAGGYSP